MRFFSTFASQNVVKWRLRRIKNINTANNLKRPGPYLNMQEIYLAKSIPKPLNKSIK